ncbi:WPE palindromic element domain-containing protein [Wolbachia endosymbiont of Rhagoletis indifferens]
MYSKDWIPVSNTGMTSFAM